jgi:hypothetical protein
MSDLIKRTQDDLTAAIKRADHLSATYPGTSITVQAQNRVNALRRILQRVTSQAAKNP